MPGHADEASRRCAAIVGVWRNSRALIETTEIAIVPFDKVSPEHAHAEGEGDRTLEHWRAVHERFWRDYSDSPRGFAPHMPVVCERFRLLYPC